MDRTISSLASLRMALGACTQCQMFTRRQGLLVSELERLKAQLLEEQRLRWEAERDQPAIFLFWLGLGFFLGVGITWWGLT